jgi:hypothetical protein
MTVPSAITTPIATRVPNHVADRLRYQAERHGLNHERCRLGLHSPHARPRAGRHSDRRRHDGRRRAMTATSPPAVRADAKARLQELQAVRAVLLPDADDAHVQSELTSVENQIRSAKAALRGHGQYDDTDRAGAKR